MKFYRELTFVQLDYELVHNIIYGGNEYAEEHGFKILKDFTKLTRYIMEIDDERIPLINLEFGKDGKPLVICSLGSFKKSKNNK